MTEKSEKKSGGFKKRKLNLYKISGTSWNGSIIAREIDKSCSIRY